jgi:formate dehydrogenase iron-sulfur subunit
MACKAWNGLSREPDRDQGIYEKPVDLSADTWTLIKLNERSPDGWHFFNYQCMHCTDAACVTVCPADALYKDELGFTAFDKDKCIGCGYCTKFCPYGVPQLKTANLLTGSAKAGKCTFCQDRIWTGIGGPFCAEKCPVEALVWGKRQDLLDVAKARVTTLKEQGRTSAKLYGETEAGGLHRLSILFDEPDQYNLPTEPKSPATARAWQKIVQPLGQIAFGTTIVGALTAFLLARRNVRMEGVE